MTLNAKSQSGQALVLGMALVIIASAIIFFVLNSGRAVNEKINLVNAADAAAYSGAQLTARQLNFMAYTNRAMIANEVAIGHAMSFQMELKVVSDSFQDLLTNINNSPILNIVLGLIDLIFRSNLSDMFDSSIATTNQMLSAISGATDLISGAYALALDANNAFYSSLQQDAFRDFSYPSDGRTLLESAMSVVVQDYELRPTSPISLNDNDTLQLFADDANPDVSDEARAAAKEALNMNRDFCKMVLFVNTSAESTSDIGAGNNLDAFCDAIAENGTANDAGTYLNPSNDEGAMVEILRNSVSTMANAEWIRNRNSSYNHILFPISVARTGSTTADYADGKFNWFANNENMKVTLNLGLIKFTGQATVSGNVADLANSILGRLDSATLSVLEANGLCGGDTGVDCETMANEGYSSSKRYTYLKQGAEHPKVTAFVAQQKCGDNIGVDSLGNKIEGWHDNLRFLEEKRKLCEGTVYAYSQAEVYYERPLCDNSSGQNCNYGFASKDSGGAFVDKPNLFNPFWQVRMVPQ